MNQPASARPGVRNTGSIKIWSGAIVFSFLLNLGLFNILPGLMTRVSEYKRNLDLIPDINVVRVKPPEPLVRKKKTTPKQVERPKKQQIKHGRIQSKPMQMPLPFETAPSLPLNTGALHLPAVDMSALPGFHGVYDRGDIDRPLTPLSQAPPIYPMQAKRKGIEGWVKVMMLVAEDGHVEKADIVDAAPIGMFEQSVIDCLSSWRFTAGTIEGIPVKTRVVTTIHFKLDE